MLSLEGTFNKGLTNLDMVVLSSLSLGLWKTICFRKEDNKLFTSNFSALFIEAVAGRGWGGAVPIVLWVFERAAHGCCGLEIGQSRASLLFLLQWERTQCIF